MMTEEERNTLLIELNEVVSTVTRIQNNYGQGDEIARQIILTTFIVDLVRRCVNGGYDGRALAEILGQIHNEDRRFCQHPVVLGTNSGYGTATLICSNCGEQFKWKYISTADEDSPPAENGINPWWR